MFAKTFDDAIEFYKIRIDLCTDVTAPEDFHMQLVKLMRKFDGKAFSLETFKKYEPSYYKKLKKSICTKDEWP